MKIRVALLLPFAFPLLTACEQSNQPLPFGTNEPEVSRLVPSTGALLTAQAGASVNLPAGAVPAGTRVSLTTVAAAEQSVSGAAASPHAFRIEPAGVQLAAPAEVDIKLDRARKDAWLAALVVATHDGAIENGEAQLDLTSGIIRGKTASLGTLSAVIPEPAAVVVARPISQLRASLAADAASASAVAAAPTSPTRALKGACGEIRNRCHRLAIGVSENLLRAADTIAAVFPRIEGQLNLFGSQASGKLVLTAPLRVRLSKGTAVTLPSEISAEATAATVVTETAGRLTLSNMRIRGSAGPESKETTATLEVRYDGTQASIVLDQKLVSSIGAGHREPARIVAELPLVRVQ